MPAERAAAAEVARGERLVDDRDGVGRLGLQAAIVKVGELAAGDERHAHRLEEAGTDSIRQRPGALTGLCREPLDRELRAPSAAAEERLERVGARGDARHSRHALLQRPREPAGAFGVVAVRLELDRKRHRPRRPEAGVDGEQVIETADEEPGAQQQEKRERHLHDHQRLAHSRLLVAAAAAALQRRDEIDSGAAHGRREPGNERRCHGDDTGEEQDAQVWTGVNCECGVWGLVKAEQRVGTPAGDQQPGGSADGRKDQALDQQQARDLPAAAAEGESQRHLAAPRGAARDQQVGDVGTDDQKDAGGDRHQDEQRLADRRPQARVPLRRIVDGQPAFEKRPARFGGRRGERRILGFILRVPLDTAAAGPRRPARSKRHRAAARTPGRNGSVALRV